MNFYPPVVYPPHEELKESIKRVCTELNARCIDMVRYYELEEEDAEFIKRDFSHEALWTRTLPDLFVHPTEPPCFYIDGKTKSNLKYENISIELSSFYWTFRRNAPDSRGVKCNHLYASLDKDGCVRIFSPLLIEVSRVIIPLFHWFKGNRIPWSPTERGLFRHYAECIVDPKSIQEKAIRQGSGDPFVLIPQESLESHMELRKFLLNRQERSDYLRRECA